MRHEYSRVIRVVAVLCVAVLGVTSLTSCQTYGEAAGLGAGLGAVTGAVIGHQSGHTVEGAAIGAVVGGLAGLIAHDIKVRQARSKQETEAAYNYQPSQGEMLTLERTEVLPPSVRPGEQIEATVQYALLGTGGSVQVSEQRTLMRGDQVISDVSTQNFTRPDGTWVSSQTVRLPGNIQPGTYTIVTVVRTARSAISARADFNVL
ncbi:MAG TPA: glycine zipper domain-containing protein [Candidatus Hydrogenedentes bacterium]|nr:glycine zipper family protein [Candidatus Hydrogenedentota bacterium]HOJ67990.1 glycine zipper domain-containing protein [Candidatus Hydrogenedentota bacterium]HOK89566.1 glycine zipper domain-containing protein [Candidatus Hydrogenedentota bacterium]HOV60027.1 glycine zipper domain-containing protein [Candidatus Hydrogenedentota bacterium]HPO31257.1 glycine zipper domain-containing protein [Candidatus Hydrogenedentota bacterium]